MMTDTESAGLDTGILSGAVIESLGRDEDGAAVLAATAQDGRGLRLRLTGPFHLEQRGRALLGVAAPGVSEAVFDSRALALNEILAIIRPTAHEPVIDGGALELRWGTSFLLRVPAVLPGEAPSWSIAPH